MKVRNHSTSKSGMHDGAISDSAWRRWQEIYRVKRLDIFRRILESLPPRKVL